MFHRNSFWQFPSNRDWAMMGILVVISSGLWFWVYLEFQKPIIDPEWIESTKRVELIMEQP